MRARILLVPLAVLALSFGELVFRGLFLDVTRDGNLPSPPASSGTRDIDLMEPTPDFGRAYDLTFERAPGAPAFSSTTRVQVQIASNGKTRVLIVRQGHPPAGRAGALRDLFGGRASFAFVADRGWLDLGPWPADGGPLRVQIIGVLPAGYGFFELLEPRHPLFASTIVRRPELPGQKIVARAPRYRLAEERSVPPGETLARFFFFFSASAVLRVAGLAALGLLLAGFVLLAHERDAAAICSVVSSVILLHGVCLPPLQGADETSQAATLEALTFRPGIPKNFDPYPRSLSIAASGLEQDRVQYNQAEALPVGNPGARATLRSLLNQRLAQETTAEGPLAPAALVVGADYRAPLYFRSFLPLGPFLRQLSIVDRLATYRLVSSLMAIMCFCAGAWLLARCAAPPGTLQWYGLLGLIPYVVAVAASTSNYAPATGAGFLAAAAAVAGGLVASDAERARYGLLLGAACLLSCLVWPEYGLFLVAGTIAGAVWAAGTLYRERRLAILAALSAFFLVVFLPAVAGGAAWLARFRMREIRDLPAVTLPLAARMLLVVIAPTVLAILAVMAVRKISARPPGERLRFLRQASAGLGTLLALGFFLTPFTTVPYEKVHLDFSSLLRAHLQSFLSNNFSWDQDRLTWKFYFGAFGWHDVYFPDFVYALGRWACVALLIALPFLCARFVESRAAAAARLVLVSGIAVSCSVVVLLLRYLGPGNPYGRYVLPYLPLMALPLLTQATPRQGERVLRVLVGLAVCLHVWTAISLLGRRYFLGG